MRYCAHKHADADADANRTKNNMASPSVGDITIEVFEMQNGTYSLLSVYVRPCEYQRSKSHCLPLSCHYRGNIASTATGY